MTERTVCILGGSGFVGRHLASRLVRDNWRVRIPTRYRERHRGLLVLPTVDLVQADVHDPGALDELFSGCGAVINLVGILNEQGRDGSGFRHAHVALARKVVDACARQGVRRLLHMSALGADAEKGPSHYLRTKGEAEDLVHEAKDLQVTSFRPSVIFGPDDSFFNRFAALLRITPYFFPLACPEARFAPVYVGDVVDAYAVALTEKQTIGQRYALCGPQVYTLKELVEYTARLIGVRRMIVGLSDGLSRLQARALEFVPGKPFSWDNYLSMQRDSVCSEGFPEIFQIRPADIDAVVPMYLGGRSLRSRYQDYRSRNYWEQTQTLNEPVSP